MWLDEFPLLHLHWRRGFLTYGIASEGYPGYQPLLFSPVVALHSTGALGSHGGIHLRYLDWPCTSPHQPSPVAAGACNIISRLALHNWPKLDSQISDTDRA